MRNITSSFVIVINLSMVAAAARQLGPASPTTLVSFNGADGASPFGGLIADADGNLFGTTEDGGAHNRGTVFELAKTATGYASAPEVLVSFGSYAADGQAPLAGLMADANGNLFGTTANGGQSDGGTVFEILNNGGVYATTSTILASFNGPDGEFPFGRLIADSLGNLFGTTASGGDSNQGTVFELVKTGTGYEKVTLASFHGADGATPASGLLADANGDLFGTTSDGGASGQGTVFEMTRTGTGYSAPIPLVSFDSTDGANPAGDLLADASGNLFGTTFSDGANGFGGTVFEVVKTASGYASTPKTLFNFNGTDGSHPQAGLIADANGNLFGTTFSGGADGDGTVFEIAKTSTGYASAPITLASFNFSDGAEPAAPLLADASGNRLFGTTVGGGTTTQGTVFEVTVFAGTPGASNCISQSTLALIQQYGNPNRAAIALGYSTAGALQQGVSAFCGQ